jgi:hypothetical protein
MEILDLSKHANDHHENRRELEPSQFQFVGFESNVRVGAHAFLDKQKPGQVTLKTTFEIIHDAYPRGTYVRFTLPLDAFPEVAIDLKSSVRAFKLSRFSILDFAFSVLLRRLAHLTFALEENSVLIITLRVGEHMARSVIDLNEQSDVKRVLGL